MAYYIYLKKTPAKISYKTSNSNKVIGFGLFFSGLLILSLFLGPNIFWRFYQLPQYKSSEINAVQAESIPISVNSNSDGFSYFTTNSTEKRTRPYAEFKLTIPDLDISDAIVKVDDLDFSKNLSHFPGTALPGEVGNVFITGHSVLPQFFNPKDFNSIFSTLPNLKIGDTVLISVSGIIYQYQVVTAKIVNPGDISVIFPQDTTGKYLTLMTCVPPGLATERLIVQAKLVEENFEN